MAYICDICGKGKQYGHNVSFSQRKTNKVWKPNLQQQRITIDGTSLKVKICTQCMRTLDKYERQKAETAEQQEETKEPAKAKAKAAK